MGAGTPWPAVTLARAHEILTAPGMPFEMEDIVVRGIALRSWKNAPRTLRDVFMTARAHGDKPFLVYQDERVTFDAFARAALALATELTAQGVKKGDRVVVAMRNLPEWPVAFFGAMLSGAVVTPLNSWWTGGELQYGLADSGARAAIVDADRFARLADQLDTCPALNRVYVSRSRDGRVPPAGSNASACTITRLEDVIGTSGTWSSLAEVPAPDVPLEPDDDVTILYTSGTTGRPKGTLGTHRNAGCAIMAAALTPARNFVRRGDPLPAPDPGAPQKSVLLAIPFFHTTGCHAIMNPSMMAGAKLVLLHKWDAEVAMQLIERERVTSAGGVPTIAWQLIEHPARERYDLSSLDTVSYGGAPASSELVRRIREVFPGSAPGLGWGMTETSSTFTGHTAEDYIHRPESSGPALPVCDMKIIDDAGHALPAGTVGELLAKGPNIVKGYWNKPEATAQTFADGWVRTGDLARIDDEGFLFIIDRKKDMLIRGGENIYCIEVESALYEHPAVMDAAVVGMAHRTLGEEPVAVVTLKAGARSDEHELRAFVAARLAAFKVPVKVMFFEGTLPRNANGKIIKAELRKMF